MSSYEVVQREAVPYAAIAIAVPMERLASAGPLNGAVFDWLAQQHVVPAGPPFWKYNVIDMAGHPGARLLAVHQRTAVGCPEFH